MKKILSLYNRIFNETPMDKQLHFAYGFLFNTLFFLTLISWPYFRHNLRVWEMGIIVLVPSLILIGAGREILQNIIQSQKDPEDNIKSKFDWQDVKATFYGAVLSSIVLTLALHILYWTCAELKF